MASVIRLRREGSKNRPFYKVVVADKRSPRDGKFIEILGSYDPLDQNQEAELKLDRLDYWLGQGAQISDRVKSIAKKARKNAEAETSA